MKRTPGQAWWYGRIEQHAYQRLGELRRRMRPDASGPLWDGRAPVPVEHVAEHVLGLSISYDDIEEREGETILGCLRPETREIVLNERHADRFRENPGTERHTICHECGQADLFGDVASATEQLCVPELMADYWPRKRSAARGEVNVLRVLFDEQLRGRSPAVRTEVMRRWQERERQRISGGEDSPLVRRAVDHYAATLLMPEDLLRAEARGMDLSRWSSVSELARRFAVSKESMRIQLEQLGLVYGVDEHNRILLQDPKEADQLGLL